jgi:hypothetical protein
MKQHPYTKHMQHKITFDTTKVQVKPNFWLIHAGRLFCKECNVQIKWLSDYEVDCINQWDFENRTLEYFLRNTKEDIPTEDNPDIIFLTVTYQEKDKAKKLGAQWHPHYKVWYTYRTNKKASNLKQWMLPDDIKVVEAYERYLKTTNLV